ncbi:MAG: DUF4250 domain-containing protein [Bacteroidaceae bacterium]|nr:DUF4250 domain-containing protein [Bacteroidaceae bacterium]
MDRLPKDPFMLVSSINMLLRDKEFESLEDICSYFDREVQELESCLANIGYAYSKEKNCLYIK